MFQLRHVSKLLLSFSLCVTPAAWTQSTAPALGFAAFGYTRTPDSLAVAPSQILVVSVFGLSSPLITNDISVTLKSPSKTDPQVVELVGVEQSSCAESVSCLPIANLTLLMPPDPGDVSAFQYLSTLEISQKGALAGRIPVHLRSDAVHVINSCDQTAVFLSAASGVPAGTCGALVLHAHGPVVTEEHPAEPGETLLLFAYGLGATTPPIGQISCCQLPLARPPDLNVDFRPNAAPQRSYPGFGIAVAPAFAGYLARGLYQVNFVVPPIPPSGVPACGQNGVRSNMTVTISSAVSYDAAPLCVRP